MLNDILHQVTKPARYTGGEWNSIVKDWGKTTIRFALCFPETYEIGMSNMALPIIYELLNSQPDTLAERAFAPWLDMETAMRTNNIPLFSLESKRPLKDFDVIGFSLDYELSCTNVLNMLDLAHIPILAAERDDSLPLIIAGGSSTLNPEPMADFIDLFVIGDGEEVTLTLLDCIRNWQKGGGVSKEKFLRQAAAIPGIYVPRLYQVEYEADGLLKSFTPTAPEAGKVIQRQVVAKLPPPVTRPVVPYIEVIHDRGAIEVQRGCSYGCRFCQAGMVYRPVRQRPQEEVLKATEELIANCGYDEISLVSLNTSDYAGINELVNTIACLHPNLALSLPSLRLDSRTIQLLESLTSRNKPGLTLAPEAGSERLRKVINKKITEASILETAATAFERGWTGIKLYFMVGLPTETLDDVAGIVQLVERIRTEGRKAGGRMSQIRISVATFVPKPHTPFQWVSQENEGQLNARHKLLQQGLNRKGIRLSWSAPETSLLEAALSRGDRRLGKVIYYAWKLGCKFDAWTEQFNYEIWLRAFAEAGLEPGFYAYRERTQEELLPWSHIDTGVTDAFLKREFRHALEGKTTEDCRYYACNTCGLEGCQPACQQKLKNP